MAGPIAGRGSSLFLLYLYRTFCLAWRFETPIIERTAA